ncbi:MAG: tRNA pseudouridine(55) synthase TruB [Clostridia bacterium]
MNGILIVNKPKEYTSHDVVAKVKKICKEKVGHTGTLDPMATGVLPLLIGQGTKLSKYLINHNKIYIATIKLGQKTDTLDSEGKIIEEKQVNLLNLEQKSVEKVLNKFIGKQKQTPPMYSAIKVNGKKLYEYARKNMQVEIPEREIEIYSIELLNINKEEKIIEFKVHCSKGTYIRTLCEAIAEELETVGYMKELNRVKVGEFDLSQAVTIEEIENNKNKEDFWNKNVISIEEFFENKPTIELEDKKLQLFLNGVQLSINKADGLYQIRVNNGFIGIGVVENNLLKRELIF